MNLEAIITKSEGYSPEIKFVFTGNGIKLTLNFTWLDETDADDWAELADAAREETNYTILIDTSIPGDSYIKVRGPEVIFKLWHPEGDHCGKTKIEIGAANCVDAFDKIANYWANES